MQTQYLIKNIFVLAPSSLLRAARCTIYRAMYIESGRSQNPRLIVLIRRDCERKIGEGGVAERGGRVEEWKGEWMDERRCKRAAFARVLRE